MLGSGSNIRPVNQAGAGTLVPCCPTRQHRVKTAEVCADWAFVLAVSPVSANLKIIDSIQGQGMRKRGWALFGALAPVLRQVRLIQRPRSFVVRQQEWDTRETPETHALASVPMRRPLRHYLQIVKGQQMETDRRQQKAVSPGTCLDIASRSPKGTLLKVITSLFAPDDPRPATNAKVVGLNLGNVFWNAAAPGRSQTWSARRSCTKIDASPQIAARWPLGDSAVARGAFFLAGGWMVTRHRPARPFLPLRSAHPPNQIFNQLSLPRSAIRRQKLHTTEPLKQLIRKTRQFR